MIETPAIVNRTLTKHCDRQGPLERVLEKALHFPRIRQGPRRPAVEANHCRGAYKSTSRNWPAPGYFGFSFRLEQRVGNLRVGGGHPLLDLSYLFSCERNLSLG